MTQHFRDPQTHSASELTRLVDRFAAFTLLVVGR